MVSGIAGNRKGIALEAIRCSTVTDRGAGKTLAARDRFAGIAALEERDVVPRGIARGGDGQRVEVAGLQVARQPLEVDHPDQQVVQRRGVEQGLRLPAHQPAQAGAAQPPGGVAERAAGIDAIDLRRLEAAPDQRQARHGVEEFVGPRCEHGRIDGPGGRSGEDPEGVGVGRPAAVEQHATDAGQHADLVGGARAAAGEDQADRGWSGCGRRDWGDWAHGRGHRCVPIVSGFWPAVNRRPSTRR